MPGGTVNACSWYVPLSRAVTMPDRVTVVGSRSAETGHAISTIATIARDTRRRPKRVATCRSERESDRELHDPRVARVGDRAERGGRIARIRVAVVHRVEEIERFGAHVRGEAIEPEALHQAQIGRPRARTERIG